MTGLTPGVLKTPDPPQGFAALAKPFSTPTATQIIAGGQPLQSTAQSQYLEGLIGANEPNKLMAANQGAWDELGNALVQSGGNLIMDIGEGLGYLNPYEIYKDIVNKDQEFGNSFSNWFAEKSKELGEEVPIYSDPENKRWHEWFFENTPSVVSGLSLLLPAYGVVKGAAYAGKAMKGLQAAKALGIGTSSLEAAEVIGMATVSRQMEGMMEAKELYDKMYQDGLARGMGEENAKKLASEGARETYTDNWALLASDVVQFGMGLKSFGKASRAYSDTQKAAKSLLNNKAYVFGTQMGLESGEEVFQAVRQKENERQTLINAQLIPDDYTTFKDRLYNYLGEDDVQTAAFFGALGGGVFEAGANVLARKEEKRRIERNNLINSSLEKQTAIFKNDPIKFNQENDVNMYSLMLDSIETGRADQIEDLLNTALEGKFSELTQEEQTEVKANVAKYKTDLKDLEEIFNNLKKDPTIQNDPQLSRYALANRAAYKIQEVTHKSLKKNQDKEILRLQEENNLDADTTKLIQSEVELSLLQNEFLKTEIKGLEKATIEDKISTLQKEVIRLQDQIKTNKQVIDLPNTSNINKSLLATFSVPKLSTELDLDQLNKKFNQLGTINGAATVKKEINAAEELKKEEGYKQTVVALQQVKSPEEVETLQKTAENLGKKEEFKNEYNKLIATKKEVAPKFDPANIKPSLTARYQNDPILFDSEITDIKKILIRTGGLPQEEELENEIETRYNSNPNFKKQLDEYFAQPTTLNTKDNTKPIGNEVDTKQDEINNKQNIEDQNKSNLDIIWQLKGLQMEAPAYKDSKVQVVERKDSILKKSDWFAVNTGKIKVGQKVSFEYDTTREYNIKNNNYNQIIIEAVVYLDKNTNNKSDSNRIIVGVLPGYNVNNNKTYTLEANEQLRTLREKLFNEIKTSTQKTGIISLSPTSTVSRINPSRFWNIKDITKHNAPHEILRADEELLFGIAKYKKLGKENVTFLDTNGDGIINQMNPKDLTAGMTYLILQAPTGEYVATSTRVKNLGEVQEEFTKVKSLIEELKNNPQNTDGIVAAINEITYIKDIRYVGNSLIVTTPDDKQETIEDIDKYLSALLMKVDGDKINKGTYNIELSKKGWITTDINPFEHFHSTSLQIQPVTITQAKVEVPQNVKVNVTVAPIQLNSKQLDGVNVKVADIEKRRKEALEKNEEEWGKRALSSLEDGVDIFKPESFEEEQEWKLSGTPVENSIKVINAKYDAELATLKQPSVKLQLPNIDIVLGKDDIKYQLSDGNEFALLNEQEVRGWFAKNLPQIDVLFVDQLIQTSTDATAFGSYWNSLVTLYKAAPATTPYHEAFHAVFEMLPQTLQDTLLKSNTEEELADQLAAYVMEDKLNESNLSKDVKDFFKKIWQYIKNIFTSNISKDELFFRINQGFYKNGKPLTNSEIRYNTGKLHPAVAMERVKMINFYFFEQLKAVANAYNLQDLTDIEILKKINDDPYKALTIVYGQVYGALKKAHDTQPEGDIKVKLKQTLDNLLVVDEEGNIKGTGDLYKLAVRELSNFGIKVKFSDKSNQDVTLEEEIPENPEEDTVQQDEEKTDAYEVKAIQKNQKDSIGFKVKKLLRTSPAFVKNANGEIELATNDIGFYKLIEFDDLYNTLQTNLADISSRDEALSILENLKEQKFELHGLIKKLSEDDILLTQFVSHFAQSQNEYIQIYESVTYGNEGGEETENRKFIVSNANKRSTNRILADTWQNNLLNVARNNITNADLSINKEKADKYATEYIGIINAITNSKTVTEVQAEQLSKILENFGIEIPAIAISNQYVKALIPYKNNYVEIHPYQNFANFIKDVTAIVTSIKNSQNPYEGETTSVLEVTKKVAKSIPNLHQSVILSSSGKNTYVYSLQTYLSKLVKDLKNPAYREELLSNWWFKHNTFLQELNKPENDILREQFNYGIFSGITYNHEEVGSDYANLTPFDLTVSDINLFDNNGSKAFAYYRLPILGDSSLSPLLRFKKFTEEEVIDGLHKIAIAEQARTKMVTTLSTDIKFYNTNGTKYKFLEIFNDNEIQPDNEVGAKQLISDWLQEELLKEKSRLTKLQVIDKQTGQFNKVVSSSRNTDKLLREYFYNNVLALSNIIQLTSVDLAFFDNYSLFIKRNGQAFKFTTFLDTQANYEGEFVGDFYNTIYIKDEKFASPIKENIIKLLKKTGSTQDYAEKIASYYDNINQTDAQAYITIDRYKKIMIGLGRWNQQYESAFQAVKKGKGNFDDVAVFLQPLKPFFYGMEKLGDLIVPVQNKNSEVVLIPQFAKQSKQLKKLLKRMEEIEKSTGLATSAQFNSTVKVGEHGAVSFDNLEAATIHTLQNRDYGIQTEVPEKHIDAEILFGSQLRKIAIADIKDETKFFNGKYSKAQIVEIYNNLIEANLKESYKETKEVFDNIEQLQEVLIQATRDRNLDYFNEQALELSKDDLGNKRFVLPLYAPINSKGSQAMVNSLIRSRITKQKINGASLVLMSNFGFSDKLNIKFDSDGNIDYMEVMLPLWTKDQYFNGLEFDKIPQDLLDLIGYRIPTEHKYSIKKLKVVGFTPSIMGGVAILPAEITKIAGEDFDIDKMYVLIPNFNIKEGKLSKVKYDLDNLNLLNKRQRDNAIIDIIGEVWKSQSDEVLTPGTFQTLIDFANYLRNVLKINDNLNPILPSSNIDYFKNITNGDGLIGIAANHNSNHSIIQYTDTAFTISIEFDGEEKTLLYKLYDVNGRLISRNLAEFLSAFVDNVKDPVAGILNINADTFKVLAAINRVGYGLETGFAFINQPIIRRLTELTQSMSYDDAVKQLEDILKVKVDLEEAKGKTNFTTDELLDSINTTPLEDLEGWPLLKQAKVLSSYKVYKSLADSLSTLVNSTKSDSNGVDKNIAGIVTLANRIKTLREDKNITTNVFETKNIASSFLKYGVKDPLNNFINKYFPYSNKAYTYLLSKMEAIKGNTLTDKEIEYLYNHATAWYMSNFTAFNINEKKAFIEKFADAFVSKRNLIKDYKFSKYIRYVGKTKDNLIPKLELYSNITITKEQIRDIKLSWETMIMSTNPEVSKLGKDLVKYAYFTTNFNFNFTGFSHLVPPSYLLNVKDANDATYAENLHKLLPESNADNIFADFVSDFAQNNHNNKIIPTFRKNQLSSKLINKTSKILTSFALSGMGEYVKVKDGKFLRTYQMSGLTPDGKSNTYNLISNKGYIGVFEYNKTAQNDSVLDINKLPIFTDKDFLDSVEVYAQLEEQTDTVNDKLKETMFRFLSSLGIKVEYTSDIYERTGVNAIALADLTTNTILVSKGKKGINALPEEVGHFAEAYSRGTVFHSTLMNLVPKTKEYAEVVKKYGIISNDPEYLTRETIGQLIGKAIIKQDKATQDSAGKGVMDYLRVVWKKFLDLFKSSDEMALIKEVEEITGIIARKVINNETDIFKTKVEINGTFYALGNTKILTEQKVLKDAADSLYKKIKIYEGKAISSFTESERVILDKLVKDFNNENYKEGIYNYVIKAVEELSKVTDRYNKVNTSPETIEEAQETLSMLKNINNYVHGFKTTVDQINILKEVDGYTPAIIESISNASRLGNRLANEYYTIGQPILKKVLKEFSTNDKLDLDAALNRLETDISWTQRWLDSLAETNSDVLSVLDKLVKDTKNTARRTTIAGTKSVVASQKEMEKGGYSATSIVAERDFNGNITGRYVTEFNLGEYYKQKEAFFHQLGPKPSPKLPNAVKQWKKAVAKWYSTNTQLRPDIAAFKQEKFLEFKQQYKKEEVALEKYNDWLEDNAVFAETFNPQTREYERIVISYKNTFYIPAEKYRSTVYSMIQENPHIKQYHDTIISTLKELDSKLLPAYKLNGFLPQVRKDFFERIMFTDKDGNKKLKSAGALKASVGELFTRNESDTEFGLTDEKGVPINFIPVYFTKKIDTGDLSLDITSSTIAFMSTVNDFAGMNKIIDTLEYAKDTVGVADLIKKGFDPITLWKDKTIINKKGEEINVKEITEAGNKSLVYQRLTDYINMIGYGQLKDIETIKVGDKTIDVGKLADFVNTYTSMTSLALNIYSGISNITFGAIQTSMEGMAGEYYTNKDLLNAEILYTRELPNSLSNIGKVLDKETSLDDWDIYMNVMQNYNRDFRDLDAARNRAQRLLNMSSLFFINHAGEHWLQNITSLALANRIKLKNKAGKEYTLWEAFKEFGTKLHLQEFYKVKGEKSTDLFKANEDSGRFTEKDLNRVINRQNFVNKRLHGIYNDMDKAAFQKRAIGRIAMMFRKFIKPGWNRRYEKLRYNEEGEVWTEGYYTTFKNLFMNMFGEVNEGKASLIKNWDKLTPLEKANLFRVGTEMAFLLLMVTMATALTQMAEDDEDNYALNLAAYESYRLYSELRFYTSITEVQRIIKSPAAAVYTLEKLNRFVSVWDWSDEVKRGKWKGFTKGEARTLDLIPGAGTYINFKSPDEQLKFFTGNGLTIF